jgi:protocatechuate 3,4-dioxygenase beta subunit
MIDDQDDLLPADAPLDALLRERFEHATPPDLRIIIAARHAHGHGAEIAARLAKPDRTPWYRALLTAAIVLLGVGAVIGTIWNTDISNDNAGTDSELATQPPKAPQPQAPQPQQGPKPNQDPAIGDPASINPLLPAPHDRTQDNVAFQLRVIDHNGDPVQTFVAQVLAMDPHDAMRFHPTAALQRIQRQPKDFVGEFTIIQGLPPGSTYVAVISDGKHAATLSDPFTPFATKTTQVTVTLNFGGELRGIVVDEQGQPVAGATIATGAQPALRGGLILAGQQPTLGGTTTATAASTTTATDGSFAITKLTPGNYQVRYQHGQFCPAVQSNVAIPMGSSKPMRIVMQHGALVHGTVRENDVPVAGCSFTILPSNLGSFSLASEDAITTDEHGRYQLTERLPPGSYYLVGYPPSIGGRAMRMIGRDKPFQRTFRIEPGKDKVQQNIEL